LSNSWLRSIEARHEPELAPIVRWTHIILSIPIIGYIYSPFEAIPIYAPVTRFVFLPVMLISGLWMWKGQWLRRLSPRQAT
jgi:hypothetical protein